MASFTLTSPAFEAGAAIPSTYTADGPDQSPPLKWSAPPSGTKSLVLIVDDPDAPAGTWVHWVLSGIPADLQELPEGVDAAPRPKSVPAAANGKNDFGRLGYGGPAPPRGGPHRYYFKLYALDAALDLPSGSTKAQVESAMKGHILAHAELMGRYQRP